MVVICKRFGITKKVCSSGGRLRVHYLVEKDKEASTILRTRRDVVLFLAKHSEFDLKPEQFSFKLERGVTERLGESAATDSADLESAPTDTINSEPVPIETTKSESNPTDNQRCCKASVGCILPYPKPY